MQSCFPNPFINELNIQIVSGKKQTVQVQVTDMLGKILFNRNENCISGTNTILLDQLDRLQAGVYLLQVVTPEKRLQLKLVKKK